MRSLFAVIKCSAAVLALVATTVAVRPSIAWAQAANPDQKETSSANASQEAADLAEVTAAIDIVGKRLASAKTSRATVELTSRSMIGDEVVSTESAVYQIASKAPNQFALSFKTEEQAFRITCDGESSAVLISPLAYYRTRGYSKLQEAVTILPAPLGPYPEPVMALTLCTVDPKAALVSDMKRVEVVDREPLNGVAAIHIRGLQDDEVTWDLWLATEKDHAQPMKMVIDLTKVVGQGEEAQLPEGFRYEVECLFTLWKLDSELAPSLFQFTPPKDSIEYESLDDFFKELSEGTVSEEHELVGKPAPDFLAPRFNPANPRSVDGEGDATDLKAGAAPTDDGADSSVALTDLKGKIVVLDFWATWCGPCIAAMPVIAETTAKFESRGVEFYAVNIGESEMDIKQFFEAAKAKPKVLLDPEGKIADAFKANAIPQTVIIGKDGVIEAVNVGYSTLESLQTELAEQLEVLASGGTLLSPGANEATQ